MVNLGEGDATGWNPIEWAEWAMNAAADRLTAAHWHDPHVAFAATGETLWWISVVNEMLKSALGRTYVQARKSENVHKHLMGFQYARNRIGHQGDVLEYVETGAVIGSTETGYTAYWHWRALPRIGSGKGSGGESEYHQVLAGNLVSATFTHTLTFLRSQARLAARPSV